MESLDKQDFYAYDGSWTNPPCTEGIKWIILKEVQGISASQIDLIKQYNKLAPGVNGDSNARAVQNIGSRTVWHKTKMSATTLIAGAASVLASAYLF